MAHAILKILIGVMLLSAYETWKYSLKLYMHKCTTKFKFHFKPYYRAYTATKKLQTRMLLTTLSVAQKIQLHAYTKHDF